MFHEQTISIKGKEVRNCIVRGCFELAKTIPKLVGYYKIKKRHCQDKSSWQCLFRSKY